MVPLVSTWPVCVAGYITDFEAADGWVLAAKYPNGMVYTIVTNQSEPLDQTHSWPAPANHHTTHIPAADDAFPFPDNHFDVITSRVFSSVVKSQSWLSVFQECYRCLKPQGWMETQSLDVLPSRHGALLKSWLEVRLIGGMEDSGLVIKPSKKVVDYLEITGFGEIKTCKIALPVVVKTETGTGQETQGAMKVMVQAGRHYYAELYAEFLRASGGKAPWWWHNKTIREECDKQNTTLGLMISFGQKVL
jgi:SAM-dependent methyltransferase